VENSFRVSLAETESARLAKALWPASGTTLVKKENWRLRCRPPSAGSGDCPLPAGGGYTGFEHNLYRIEIANVDSGGRSSSGLSLAAAWWAAAIFNAVKNEGNDQSQHPGDHQLWLVIVYLEAVEYDAALGYWRVTYGATVSVDQ